LNSQTILEVPELDFDLADGRVGGAVTIKGTASKSFVDEFAQVRPIPSPTKRPADGDKIHQIELNMSRYSSPEELKSTFDDMSESCNTNENIIVFFERGPIAEKHPCELRAQGRSPSKQLTHDGRPAQHVHRRPGFHGPAQ
jgi:hypothetical protein